MKYLLVIFFMFSSLSGMHTIYVSGPPVSKNRNWFKDSKYLYEAIKEEILSNGDEIELFPKRRYRESIVRYGSLDMDQLSAKKFYSRKEIFRAFLDKEKLLEELVFLILKRHKEIIELGLECDSKIHLMAHGCGGELLLMLKRSQYSRLIKSYVVFDGDEKLYRTISSDSYSYSSDYSSSVDNTGIVEKIADTISLAIKSDGNIILNFSIPEMQHKSGHKGEIAALVTAVVGLITAILALL